MKARWGRTEKEYSEEVGVSRRTGDGILFIKTETIVGTASSFGGGIIKSSFLSLRSGIWSR